MSVRDFWNRTQVYFGIKEEDWDEEYFDDDGSENTTIWRAATATAPTSAG